MKILITAFLFLISIPMCQACSDKFLNCQSNGYYKGRINHVSTYWDWSYFGCYPLACQAGQDEGNRHYAERCNNEVEACDGSCIAIRDDHPYHGQPCGEH